MRKRGRRPPIEPELRKKVAVSVRFDTADAERVRQHSGRLSLASFIRNLTLDHCDAIDRLGNV